MKITKSFEFESAHRLSNYNGKCERIHGHNYKCIATLEGNVDDRGILVDFSDVKKIVKEFIIEPFDHRLILNSEDPFNKGLDAHLEEGWIKWMKVNPTAENMAWHFLEILKEHGLPAISVEVFETPDSSAIAE